MKKDRSELNKYFEQLSNKYIQTPSNQAEIQILAETKYNIPPFRVQTILQHNAAIEECDDIELFWLLQCIYEWKPRIENETETFFTNNEIRYFSSEKYERDKIEWPIRFPAFCVEDDQWIGFADARTLTRMRKNNLLNYNKNIQRRVKTVVRGDAFYDMIDLNKKAVNDIARLIREGKFIPNTITLNFDINDADFFYDNKNHMLVFNNINHLDILDGYHRFVALSRVIDENPSNDFNINFEIRFTCYSDDKANQFIWQEEQKTRVPKKDVRTYNMEDIANKITKRVNESSSCNLAGRISRGGFVDYSIFSESVDRYYINRMNDEQKRTAIVIVSKDLIESINIITENDISLLTKRCTNEEVRIMVFVMSKFFKKDKTDLFKVYNTMINSNINSTDKYNITLGTRKSYNILESLFEEACNV